MSYWKDLSLKIEDICNKYNLKYKIFWNNKKKEEKLILKQESFKLF